jgi:hypothetical protein
MVPVLSTATECSIPAPADPGLGVNVAIARKPGVPGICSDVACFIPIDQDPDFGWTQFGDRIQLPPAVCERLALPPQDKLSIVGLATTTSCATKTAQIPTCGLASSVGLDAGTFQAAPPAGFDAAAGGDGGILLPDGGTCDPTVQWPKMLAAPIVPPNSIANLDLSNGGKGTLTIDEAELVNCGGTTTAGVIGAGTTEVAWGSQTGDVLADYDDTSRAIVQVTVRNGYKGQLTFNGASHAYVIGVGALQRDGVALTVDWTNPNPTAQELYTAYMQTYYATPGDANCVSTGDCFANPNGSANGSGIALGVHQVFPLYIVFPKGGSVPNELYTTRKPAAPSGDGGTQADASAPLPDGGGPVLDAAKD